MTNQPPSTAPVPTLLHKLRAHIVWLAFGECRSPGWDGPPPTARDAVDAIDAALSAATPAPAPSDRISTALCAPGCERLYEFAAVGPVQRAAVESFADVLLPQVAEHAEPVAWLVEWVVAGQVWTHAHASELPAVDQARRHAGKLTPLYAAPQAPHPATAAGGGEP